MSQEQQNRNTSLPVPAEGEAGMPQDLKARFNGQLNGQSVVAWSEFDLDEQNKYAKQFVVLTETQVLIVGEGAGDNGKPPAKSVEISSVEEAKTIEGMGVDRLSLIAGNKVLAEMRYSKRHRRGMTKLQRKLERRLPNKKEGKDVPPDWLEVVEREAELKEHCPKCGQLIPAYAEGVCPNCLQQRKILWRLLDVAKPYRKQIWFALFLTLIFSGMTVLPPIFVKQLIDTAVEPKIFDSVTGKMQILELPNAERTHRLMMWSAGLVAVIVLSEWIGGWRMRMLARMGTNVTRDLRHQVYAHLHELSLRYFAKRRTGSLITRVTNDTDRLWDFIVFGSVNLIRDITMIFGIAIVMFWMNWRLAFLALLPLPILAVLTYYRGMKMQRMFHRLWGYWSRMSGVVGDALPGVRVVKAFANEQKEVNRFNKRSDEYTEKEQEIHVVWTQLQPIVSGLMQLGTVLIWMVGGYFVITQPGPGATVGTLMAFTAFVARFYGPIMELANSNRMITRAATSAQRVFEVLDTPPDIYSKPDALKPVTTAGRVEFKQVAFSYEGTQPALRDVSVVFEPGQMVGLCGPSGAGKSTFVNLISRFYDPIDGQILLDGHDLREYDVKWLRRQIGMVLQEPYLFHGTITDNIRYGNTDATNAQIVAAAKAANAHDFVVGFPDGYDTMVGERGQSLSGGERQRISIARAILHNPRILILDEATSSVDTETEKQIQQALDRLVEGRTTIAIAHRLSTLQAAHRLVVLEKGKIAEEGRHEELVDKEGGVYAKLHKTQAEMNAQVAIR